MLTRVTLIVVFLCLIWLLVFGPLAYADDQSQVEPTCIPGVPCGPIVTASRPTDVPTSGPVATATTGFSTNDFTPSPEPPNGTAIVPTATAYKAPIAPLVDTPTAVPVCGSVVNPCYQAIQLPVIYEGGGGGILGLLIAYGLVFPWVNLASRVVSFLGVLAAIFLFVLSGMFGWLYGAVLVMLIITPVTELVGFARGIDKE